MPVLYRGSSVPKGYRKSPIPCPFSHIHFVCQAVCSVPAPRVVRLYKAFLSVPQKEVQGNTRVVILVAIHEAVFVLPTDL